MSTSDTPQVSWKGIEAGARLVATDGHEIGRIDEVAGDEEGDIFEGHPTTKGVFP